MRPRLSDRVAALRAQREAQSRTRTRRSVTRRDGVRYEVDGHWLTGFCSNDYLGLAQQFGVVNAMQDAASRDGAGGVASHLVCGHHALHDALERELADWLGAPRALLFGNGFLANLGVVQSLLGDEDVCVQDRLDTLGHVRDAGMKTCCGGIVGMGESRAQRAGLLHALATLPAHPDSVPINRLVQVAGTPLAGTTELDPFEFVRTIAVARILMPRSMVRLSAGRETMSDELQALCFAAGANSIFHGEKLLTTGNPDTEKDRALFERLGLRPMHVAAAEVASDCSTTVHAAITGAAA